MGLFGGRRQRERREPRLEAGGPGDDLRADPADRAGGPRKGGSGKRGKAKTPKASTPLSGGRARRRRGPLGWLVYWTFTLAVWGAIGIAGLFAYHFAQLPPIDQLAVPKRPPNIAILAADGTLIANRGDTGGAAVKLAELPPYVPNAFVAIEDRRFRSHFGVDPVGVGRAVFNNLAGRRGMQGGSTITQQLAKNLFLTQERTLSRKIQEAILALWLERKYSKDQILELYLNRVYFGAGAYGVDAAARKYYDKSARQLTLAEAATLAGLMVAPSKLAPNRNPDGARARAEQVIAAMKREGFITPNMAQAAETKPAQVALAAGGGSANYAADYVMDMLDETVGAVDEDIVVATTLQPRMQAAAERALDEELARKGGKYGVTQGAVVALDPGGAIRALVGGRDYAQSQFNRAVSARRQPGSAFKPFVYLAALEKGLTPDTIRADAPINIKGWRPENYSHEYFGQVSLTQALSLSLNTVAVRLGQEVGPKAVAQTARRLGVASELKPTPALALGASEVTPLELVAAYAPFANGGLAVQPYIIARVRTAGGKALYNRKGSTLGKVIDPATLGMMNAMMRETLTTGTASKADLPGWQAAGKTGTSQEHRDAWFVGYTNALVAGVWLGNDDSSPTKKASGGNLPVDVWSRFMKAALAGTPPTPLPGTPWTGAPAGPQSDGLVTASSAPAPVPPANVGRAARPSRESDAAASRPPAERGFLERLFGG